MHRAACLALAFLWTARLFAGPALGEPISEAPVPDDSRLAALETVIEKQSVELDRLRTENQRYRTWMESVALPIRTLPFAKGAPAGLAPSSGLNRDSASSAAIAACLMVKDAWALHVLPTGSMRPTFDENAILLTEPARFEDLKAGDIVTFRHPSRPVPVVHRVLERRGDRFWSKGDGNGRMDDIYITRENFDRRVFGIIYGRESAAVPAPR